MKEVFHLGLDVGSGTAKAVIMDNDRNILFSYYEPTKGRPLKKALEILSQVEELFPKDKIQSMTCTGTGGKNIASILKVKFVNEVICHTKAVEFYHPEARTIIDIGGEDSKLILVKPKSNGGFYIHDFALNTVCAAGTGAFLEQQAARLGYSIEEFSRLALKAKNIPSIAGRCTVFAKSDMIHLQQNGVPDFEIIAGLCYAIVRNLKTNIGKGKKIVPPLVFQGGVAANLGVRRAIQDILLPKGEKLIIPKHFKIMGAIGAALEGLKGGDATKYPGKERLKEYLSQELKVTDRFEPLKYDPSSKKKIVFVDLKNSSKSVYVGIDVGSVSTKVAVLEFEEGSERFRLIAKSYLPTAGRPLEAIKKALKEVEPKVKGYKVLGVGATGSGRYLCGDFVGADVIRNEITAQVTAAMCIEPEVDTIFEIGGQDSKYIFIQNGNVVDFALNKVCAAGTGSFLEEQAVRLGIDIKEFGDLALSSKSPVKMGERCTVFMQSDLVHYQQKGVPKEDLAAGLCYSIVYNYLNKVVERRKIGKKIVFQGGTAFNKGIVAAFESVLKQKITVPEHNEVTGAIGAAILAKREHKGPSRFKGFDLTHINYTVETFECNGCANCCEIQKITIEGEKRPFFYGSRCDRYEEKGKRLAQKQVKDFIRTRQKILLESAGAKIEKEDEVMKPDNIIIPPLDGTKDKGIIGIPRTLFFQEWLPFFSTLFRSLGYSVMLSKATNKRIIQKGAGNVTTETCLPIKAAHGHVLDLLENGAKYIFLPQICEIESIVEGQLPVKICPFVQGIPWTIKSAIDFSEYDAVLLNPVLRLIRDDLANKEWKEFAKMLKEPWSKVKKAVKRAWAAQDSYQETLVRLGQKVLEDLRGEKAVLIVGRPYNAFDPGMNMDLSQKLKRMGIYVIPIDFLPLKSLAKKLDLSYMYWSYGQKILASTAIFEEYPNLYPIFITNFACGPDAFILHFYPKNIDERPFLELEIDEHTADAGVITRIEAFWENVKKHVPKYTTKRRITVKRGRYGRDMILYIPPMADHQDVLAAAFKAKGADVRVIPWSDETSLYLGRKYTKGKECLPAVLTTGDILKTVFSKDFDPDRSAFFMPAARGPCRFGLYNHMHRLILDELGFKNVQVYSPNQSYTLYKELGVEGEEIAKPVWKGVVAVDLLIKILLETRPYVKDKQECNRIYREYLNKICEGIMKNYDLLEILEEANEKFLSLPRIHHKRKPVVGIVGEIYVRSNPFANEHIIEVLEDLGVEVWMPTIGEWIHYVNYTAKRDALRERQFRKLFALLIEIYFQNRIEKTLTESFNERLRSMPEPDIKTLLKYADGFLDPRFEGEAILSIGKTIDYIKKGVKGIVNVIPFTCMPGGVVDALLKRVKKIKDIPMLTVVFDGQKETNTRNRLEAFVYQVCQSEE